MPLVSLLGRGRFPNAWKVAELHEPVLIAHGRADGIIPFSEGEKLYAAAKENTEFLAVDGAGHNDFFEIAGEIYLRELQDLFNAWTHPQH